MRVPCAGVQEPDGRRVFHAVTDGTGGLIFLKTLLAEYLSEKYGLNVPAEHGVLGRLEEPDEEELEDSFLRYAGDVKGQPQGGDRLAFKRHAGPDGYVNLVTMMLRVPEVKACAEGARGHGDGASVRGDDAGNRSLASGKGSRSKPQKAREGDGSGQPAGAVSEPHTLRNFASYVNTEIDPASARIRLTKSASSYTTRWGSATTRRRCARKSRRMWQAKNRPCCA